MHFTRLLHKKVATNTCVLQISSTLLTNNINLLRFDIYNILTTDFSHRNFSKLVRLKVHQISLSRKKISNNIPNFIFFLSFGALKWCCNASYCNIVLRVPFEKNLRINMHPSFTVLNLRGQLVKIDHVISHYL